MTLPKPTARSQLKRSAIHAAARKLFVQGGFERTTMDAVALAAKVSKQTLYRYYENKEMLFVATLQQLVFEYTQAEEFQELQASPMNSLPTLEHALQTWARLTVDQAMQPTYLALLRVLIAEAPHFPALSSLYMSMIVQEGRKVVAALVEDAARHGIISAVDLDAAIFALVGSSLMFVLGGLVTPNNLPYAPTPAHIAALVRLFVRGIAR